MTTAHSPEHYRELVRQVRDCVRLHVPPGSVVLMASKGDEDLVDLKGYRAWHFPQSDVGVYAGHYPANSAEAIAHLRRLQARGAQYLVFPWTSRWWLEHYGALATHLQTVHDLRISEDGVCLVFALNEAAVEDGDLADPVADPLPDAAPDVETEHIHLATSRPRYASRILTILARFGTETYPHAEREIEEIFTRQLPNVDRTVITVDNALPRSYVEERPNGVLIGGDNAAREFSAFDRAIEFVGSDIWSYDLVHLATSAFNTLFVAYLDRFDPDLLAAIGGRPVCVGHIDCYNEPIELLTFRSQHWMRSCFLFLPPAEVKALGRLAAIRDGRRFFSGDPGDPFRRDAPVSPNYRNYVTTWLTGGDIGQRVEWHSSFALTPETLPAFEQKAISILNEQLMSVRLRALGCRLVDVTWLSAQLRRRRRADIPWTASWREQLANRDGDVVIVEDDRGAVAVGMV
jgi:hypothetical protein